MKPATDRLVELAFKGVHEWAEALPALGVPVEVHEDGTVNLSGVVRAGVCEGMDPISKATTLGFTFGGMFWPQAFPDLFKEVKREWKRRKKAGLPLVDDPPEGTLPAALVQQSFLEDANGTE